MTRYGSSVGLAVILAVACLAYGAVTPVERVIVASGLAFHAAWMGRREQVRDMRLEGKWLVAASWLFVVCCVLPLIPAPLALRQLLSPVMTDVQHQVWPQQWRPLSPDPVAGLRGAAMVAVVVLWMHAAIRSRLGSRYGAVLAVSVVSGGLVVIGLLQRVLQLASPLGLERGQGTVFFGTFISANHAGVFMGAAAVWALTASISATRNTRAVLGFLGLLSAGGAFLCRSRAAPIALMVGILVAIWTVGGRRSRIAVVASALLACLGAWSLGEDWWLQVYTPVVDPTFASVELYTGRDRLYADMWRLAGVAPLVGLGAGGFSTAYRALRSDGGYFHVQHAHMEPLQVALEQGFLGLASLGAVGLALCLAIRRQDRWRERRWLVAGAAGGLSVHLVSAGFDFPWRSAALVIQAAAMLVMIVSTEKKSRRTGTGFALAAGAIALAWSALALLPTFADTRAGWAASPAATEERAMLFEARPLSMEGWRVVARSGTPEEVVDAMERAVLTAPSLPGPRWVLTRRYHASGEYEMRDKHARRLMQLDLADFERKLVRELLELGNRAEVLSWLPVGSARACVMAEELVFMGREDDGDALFETLVDGGSCAVSWAGTLQMRSRNEEALALVENADGCTADHVAGLALLALEQPETALLRFRKAMSQCIEKRLSLRVGLGLAMVRSGERDGWRVLESAVADHPGAEWAAESLRRERARVAKPPGGRSIWLPND